MNQTRPSAIVSEPDPNTPIGTCSIVELLDVARLRLDDSRNNAGSGEIAREYSIAITHIEDAITRTNKGHYRNAGLFAITDAERTAAEAPPSG